MRRAAAVLAVAAALVAVGAWLAFDDVLTAPPVVANEAPATAEAEEAPPAADADGYTPLEPLTDAPVQSFDGAESVLDPELDYRARLETSAGAFTVDLFDDRAPRTVNNFVFLALHRFYEDVPFHRVLEDFMAQTGDPTGTGTGGPGYTFADEIVPELRHDRPGTLSMANAGPDTNGSQFFVTFAATPWLDGAHAVFGEVIEGMETLDALVRVDPQSPTALARLSEPAATLADAGIEAAAGATGTVEAWLQEELGSLPVGPFELGGRLGTPVRVRGEPAVGFFPVPDRIERVTILTAPEPAPEPEATP